jgi:hypothetical protein
LSSFGFWSEGLVASKKIDPRQIGLGRRWEKFKFKGPELVLGKFGRSVSDGCKVALLEN